MISFKESILLSPKLLFLRLDGWRKEGIHTTHPLVQLFKICYIYVILLYMYHQSNTKCTYKSTYYLGTSCSIRYIGPKYVHVPCKRNQYNTGLCTLKTTQLSSQEEMAMQLRVQADMHQLCSHKQTYKLSTSE